MKRSQILGILFIAAALCMPVPGMAAGVPFNTDLRYGMQGSTEVGELQDFLRTEGYFHEASTGNFLSMTLAAVKAWQAAHCVPATGYFGPLSRQAALHTLCSEAAAVSPGAVAVENGFATINGRLYVLTDHGLVPVTGGAPNHRPRTADAGESDDDTDDDPPASPPTLSVLVDGSGGGTVTSSPSGISCDGDGDCSASFDPGTVVTLTPTPDGSSSFYQWSGGGCSGSGACEVTLDADTTITANFIINLGMGGGGEDGGGLEPS